MKVDEQTFARIKTLYGYAIKREHVGRRVLAREFDLTRTEAESVLDTLRSPDGDDDLLLTERIVDVNHLPDGTYRFEGRDSFDEPTYFDLSEEKVKRLKRDYTAGFTRAETAVKNDLPKHIFEQIRRQMDWTHDSLPLTDKEVERGEQAEELAREMALERKKATIRKEEERERLRQQRKDAKKWRDVETSLLNFFEEKVGEPEIPEPARVEQYGPKDHALVVPAFDIHFGKQGIIDETGNTYSRDEASTRLLETGEQIVTDASRIGVEKTYLPLGSDFFHVDNVNGQTSSGTQMDLDGTPGQVFYEGCDLMISFIEQLRQIGPVHAFQVSGNHDRILTLALAKYVAAWYKSADDVQVDLSLNPRPYYTYGVTLMGFDHGDGIKAKEIPALMTAEARDKISETKESVFFTGHLHHELKTDLGSVTAYQLGSPSGADRYHHRNGYTTSREQMTAFAVHREHGMRHHINYPVPV